MRQRFDDEWRDCARASRCQVSAMARAIDYFADRATAILPAWFISAFVTAVSLCLLVFRVLVYCLGCMMVYLGLACLMA